jgi:hypothetical protein
LKTSTMPSRLPPLSRRLFEKRTSDSFTQVIPARPVLRPSG